MQLKDILHYYLGQYFDYTSCGVSHRRVLTGWYLDNMPDSPKLHLRRLEDTTEGEIIELLISMQPEGIPDLPEAGDYNLDIFHNDNGLMVDEDVAIGADYTCRCYVGQIAIRKNGIINLYDEGRSPEPLVAGPQQFHYLLSLGFDLFGGIDAGWAVDVKTFIKPTTNE